MSWLLGYTYRKKKPVNATVAGAQTVYQLKLLVGESSGAAGEEIDCESHCQDFPNDIRFTDADEQTKHDYWVESISGNTPNRLATIHIEVATIPASGDVDLYMYYGKTSDSGESNGGNTFIFFDDFLGTSLDTDKWTEYDLSSGGTVTIADSIIKIKANASNSGGGVRSDAAFTPPYAFRSKAKIDNVGVTDYILLGMYKATETNPTVTTSWYAVFLNNSNADKTTEADGANYDIDTIAWDNANYLIFEILRDSSGNSDFYIDGVVVDNDHDYSPTDATRLWIYNYKTTLYKILSDWVFIRNYADPEPTWGSSGAEERGSTPSSTSSNTKATNMLM